MKLRKSKTLFLLGISLCCISLLFYFFSKDNLVIVLILTSIYSLLYSFLSSTSRKSRVRSLGPSESYRSYLEEDMHTTPAYTRRKPTDFSNKLKK